MELGAWTPWDALCAAHAAAIPTRCPPKPRRTPAGNGPASNVNNGVGPLRIWPGGLCLSRAVGDFDVGESVIPLPHVAQVRRGL